ncbi:S9 family peptidase [Thalassotalea fonticola]|uniref:S9 family peptidase n=1 Tax=Thalassotalea fonticola TaxID=3065649 RepID=A0ABZ0GSY8_9GAMM|nr:S9 family peptidase [Colwelliaceae bacterium S1-1]
MIIKAKLNTCFILFCSVLLFTLPSQANQWGKLFDYGQYQNAKISPDGKHLAVSVLSKNKQSLVFFEMKTFTIVGGAKFSGKYEVGDYQWVNNERVVINMVKRRGWLEKPVFYGELYAVNYDGSRGEMIYGYQSGEMQTGSAIKKKKSTMGWADIIDILPEDEKHILISSTPMSKTGERTPSVFKLNIYSGVTRKKLATSPVPFARFLTDTSGKLRAVVGTDKNDQEKLYIRNEDEWHLIDSDIVGTNINPLAISASGKYLYSLDNHQQDLRGVFKLDLEDYSYKNFFTDQEVNITSVEMTTDGRSVYAVKLDDGYPSYVILNSKLEEAKVYKDLIKSFPYSEISITSKTKDGNFYVVYVSSDVDPGQIFLFDKKQNKLMFLFKYKPEIKTSEFVQVEPIEFKAADGQKIDGYFTQGKATTKDKIAPVVVLVHGGPHGVRDYWNFSSQVQYLALNGYSVLQINYRGSGGYGHDFESAGHQAWGSITQQDIHDGYQWLVKQNKAIANNVCIMGASFGAYSAIQSTTLYPDTYKCAIANAGIYDLELMFDKGDIQERRSGLSYLNQVLGSDQQQLKSMSPVNYVDRIDVPLLLAHGKEDERAPLEHAERLREALDKANKPYEWFILDKEGHGFFNPENQKAYMKKVVSFLDKHLI